MAQQTGILGLRGTVGGLTFRNDGSVSQAVGSRKISAQRTLENNSEFGLAGKYGKVLRDALRTVIASASDRYVTSRLASKMLEVIKLDDTSNRGERVFDATNSAPLLGFNFNANASIGQVFYSPFTVAGAGADVTLDVPVLNPLTDLSAPQGATHFELVFAATALDMEQLSYTSAVVAQPLGIQPVKGAAQAVNMKASFPAAPSAAEMVVGVVGVKFYQQVNGKFYELDNNATNPLAIEFLA